MYPGQDRLPFWFSDVMEGWGGEEEREAKQAAEGQTDLLGNATKVFPHEDSRRKRQRRRLTCFHIRYCHYVCMYILLLKTGKQRPALNVSACLKVREQEQNSWWGWGVLKYTKELNDQYLMWSDEYLRDSRMKNCWWILSPVVSQDHLKNKLNVRKALLKCCQ